MSEKIRKDEGRKATELNKKEELLNKIDLSKEIEKGQNFFSEPKEEINFDSIDFNINPFKSEDIKLNTEKKGTKIPEYMMKSSYNNISLNPNPFSQNLNNQINNNNSYNYINSNNFNNQISYDNNQIINNNHLNFSNNCQIPRLREQYWFCSLCNNFNTRGKILIIFFHFYK